VGGLLTIVRIPWCRDEGYGEGSFDFAQDDREDSLLGIRSCQAVEGRL